MAHAITALTMAAFALQCTGARRPCHQSEYGPVPPSLLQHRRARVGERAIAEAQMKRRIFLAAAATAAPFWPAVVHAQRTAGTVRLGVLVYSNPQAETQVGS